MGLWQDLLLPEAETEEAMNPCADVLNHAVLSILIVLVFGLIGGFVVGRQYEAESQRRKR